MNLNLWKTRKKELKLTFKRLAQISGIPKRTIEDIFSEHTKNPRIDTIQAIEKALEISSLSSEEINAGAVDSVSIDLSAEELELIHNFRAIGDISGKGGQEMILRIIESLLDYFQTK